MWSAGVAVFKRNKNVALQSKKNQNVVGGCGTMTAQRFHLISEGRPNRAPAWLATRYFSFFLFSVSFLFPLFLPIFSFLFFLLNTYKHFFLSCSCILLEHIVLEWSPGFVSTHSISLLQCAILIPADNDISDPSDKDEVESK